MTDAREPALWERDPLYRQTLLNGCRNALRSGGFARWMRIRQAEIGNLLSAARATDTELLAELVQRPELREPLREQSANAWRRGDPQAVALTVQWMLFGSEIQMTPRGSKLFEEMLAGLDQLTRATAYREVVNALRPSFSMGTTDARRGGWIYLLTSAGKAARRVGQILDAKLMLDEAWQYRHYLPADTAETARTVAHLATTYATAIGWLPVTVDQVDPFSEVLKRLAHARDGMDAHPDTVPSLSTRIGLGIAEAQVWYLRRRSGLIGFITAAETGVAILTGTEDDVWRRLRRLDTTIVERDYQRLPPELRSSLARLLVELGSVGFTAGEPDLAVRAAQDALVLSDLPHHRMDARVTLARVQRRLDDRLRHNRDLLLDIDSGLLNDVTAWQRERIHRRLRRECGELAKVLVREGKPTAAWFWLRQAMTWPHQVSSEPDSSIAMNAGAQSSEPADSALDIKLDVTAQSWHSALIERVRTENVLAVILQLKLGAEQVVSVADLLTGVAEVDTWYPSKRQLDPDRTRPGPNATLDEARGAVLHLATEFVDGYAYYLGPQIYGLLAQNPSLPWEQRTLWARRSAASAEEAGRATYAVNAWIALLTLALERDDEAMIDECVREIQHVVRRAFATATGAADLIDLAEEMIRKSTCAAALLAEHSHPQFAFELASAATGALRRMIMADPRVAEELELVEQRGRGCDEEADDGLFTLMRERMLSSEHTPERAHRRDAEWQPEAGSLVQLLDAGSYGSWALGRTGATYWAERLDVDTVGLQELRETVWHQLRPTSRRAPVLTDLHRVVVAPLLMHLGTGDLVFVLHGSFAGLPLHAAHDGVRFLIESHCVTYLPSPDHKSPVDGSSSEVMVAGWDPAIDAGAEATEIADRLAELGLAVTRPPKATLGRQALLDSSAQWGVVHLAAHGDFHTWPMSLRSRLRLSVRISVTAGEWLRSSCRARFVFLNACNVGRHAPHAGDLNGFPLAVQVRGAIANVSALAPVPSGPAREFARRFYTHWPTSDSLMAFQEACVGAIFSGEPVSGWAPYLHTGFPIRLP